MKVLRIFFYITILFFTSFAWAEKTLIILGDSLTEGYGVAQKSAFPSLLQEKATADKLGWKIVGSGSSGSTSASGLQRIKWLAKSKPNTVLLLLGSNDGLRGIPTSETEKNLNATIAWAKENKIEVLLGQLYMPPNYGKKYTEDFAKIYSSVAKKNKVPLLGFLLEKVAGRGDLNLADGIHPNEKGHQVIADQMYSELKTYLK